MDLIDLDTLYDAFVEATTLPIATFWYDPKEYGVWRYMRWPAQHGAQWSISLITYKERADWMTISCSKKIGEHDQSNVIFIGSISELDGCVRLKEIHTAIRSAECKLIDL